MTLDVTNWIAAASAAASVLVSGTALVVTICLWQADVKRRRRDDALARRQEIVGFVVGLAEKTARYSTFRVVTQFWFKPELEWAFVLPRIYYGLERDDVVVARWASMQIRLIQSAVRRKSLVGCATRLAYGLASWERDELPTSWFADQVPTDGDPLRGPWSTPLQARAAKGAINVSEYATLGLISMLYAALGRSFWRIFNEIQEELPRLSRVIRRRFESRR